MKKKILLLTLLAALSTTKSPCEEGYVIDDGIDYSACCASPPGCCYYDSRHMACYAIGLVVGVAVIAGAVAIVINQSHCSHSH